MKQKNWFSNLVLGATILLIAFYIVSIVLSLLGMQYTNLTKGIGKGLLILVALGLFSYFYRFLIKNSKKEDNPTSKKIFSSLGVVFLTVIICAASAITLIRWIFSYQPEHVVEKDGQKMVAYVNSFLHVEVNYYDYKNPFVCGNVLRIQENYGKGGYDPFERETMPVPESTKYYDKQGNPIQKKQGENRELTQSELKQVEEYLNQNENNGFINHQYQKPSNIQIKQLLYDGAGIGKELNEKEYQEIMKQDFNKIDRGIEAKKFYKQEIDQLYQEKTGTLLSENETGIHLSYCEKYDFYYMFHSDTHFVRAKCVRGRIQDDICQVVYQNIDYLEDGYYQVTLKKLGNGYVFVSNAKV